MGYITPPTLKPPLGLRFPVHQNLRQGPPIKCRKKGQVPVQPRFPNNGNTGPSAEMDFAQRVKRGFPRVPFFQLSPAFFPPGFPCCPTLGFPLQPGVTFWFQTYPNPKGKLRSICKPPLGMGWGPQPPIIPSPKGFSSRWFPRTPLPSGQKGKFLKP